MRVEEFNFDLPEECIALEPCVPRDAAKLLYVPKSLCEPNTGFHDQTLINLLDHLEPGDGLVFNQSRVIPACLEGVRLRGEHQARVTINLHKRLSDHEWLAFARPAKKLASGDQLHFGGMHNACLLGQLHGEVLENKGGGEIKIAFQLTGPSLDQAINDIGLMPLPPYIASKREVNEKDRDSYQTIYASEEGSVAAPTAGLHFTEELMDQLEAKGVKLLKVVLHVGAGTFLPVKSERLEDHKMHSEWGEVSEETAAQINAIKASGHKICAVGTTSLRLMESAAITSTKIAHSKITHSIITPWRGETDIFITPGFEFKIADMLLTNFHLPKSTLFMLVSAFSGCKRMKAAYRHAIENNYRFYSYGDACLLECKS